MRGRLEKGENRGIQEGMQGEVKKKKMEEGFEKAGKFSLPPLKKEGWGGFRR